MPTPKSVRPPRTGSAERSVAKSMLMSPRQESIAPNAFRPAQIQLFARPKASSTSASSPPPSRSMSLCNGMTASQPARSAASASRACLVRRSPSHEKGSVTNATTIAPASAAAFAITGAAPLPVPPPRATIRMTRSQPATSFRRPSESASAARRPSSTSPPAPSPRVSARPITSRSATGDEASDCTSVFTAAKTALPAVSGLIAPPDMSRSTVFTPPPPTPMTFMRVSDAVASSDTGDSFMAFA